jgi:hypothetical protein
VKELTERKEDGTRRQSGIIITGTSGIGKTFFGFYFAHRLLQAGEIVAFNYRNNLRVVLAPPVEVLRALPKDDKRRFLLDLLEKFQQGQLASLELAGEGEKKKDEGFVAPHFWGMIDSKDNEFWQQLLDNDQTWLLVDLHSEDKYEEGLPGCKIVVTSPQRVGGWPDLDSGSDLVSRKLFMGPPSLEEVKSLKSSVNLDISDTEIENRFEQFGGSTRLLFSDPVAAKQKVEEAFATNVLSLLDPST